MLPGHLVLCKSNTTAYMVPRRKWADRADPRTLVSEAQGKMLCLASEPMHSAQASVSKGDLKRSPVGRTVHSPTRKVGEAWILSNRKGVSLLARCWFLDRAAMN